MNFRKKRYLWFAVLYLLSLAAYATVAFVERGALRLLR
jgi:hypothetical protein